MSDVEKQEIKNKIEGLEAKKAACKGSVCEVYTRVTGYIRQVSSFNPGKQEEVKMRKMYTVKPCTCAGK
jgi:anaerobic ribonucleoside-triphosphate reductase